MTHQGPEEFEEVDVRCLFFFSLAHLQQLLPIMHCHSYTCTSCTLRSTFRSLQVISVFFYKAPPPIFQPLSLEVSNNNSVVFVLVKYFKIIIFVTTKYIFSAGNCFILCKTHLNYLFDYNQTKMRWGKPLITLVQAETFCLVMDKEIYSNSF